MTMQLPPAIKTLRRNIYVIAPAYRELLHAQRITTPCAEVKIDGLNKPVRLFEGKLPGSSVKLLLVEIPSFFDRPDNTAVVDASNSLTDNEGLARFCQIVAAVAMGDSSLDWKPQLVHCNGWQTGLVPALLAQQENDVTTLFTLFNPGDQECVALEQMVQWGLPPSIGDDTSIVQEGQLCFTRAALRYADMVSTTSATYARELCTNTAKEHGIYELMQQRHNQIHGILNGINYQQWNPAKDKRLPRSYNSHTLDDKILSKLALQREFNLPPCESCCLIGILGDLSSEKGTDLVLEIIPQLLQQNMQIILLGRGEGEYVARLREICMNNSAQIAAHIREDNRLAHLIIGGADLYLAPARHDPCATSSRLALRYGTIPAVTNCGALADSVIDSNDTTLANNTASGFLLDPTSADSLLAGVSRAISLYQERPKEWKKIAINGMQQDFSWRRTAKQYIDLYKKTIEMRENSNIRV